MSVEVGQVWQERERPYRYRVVELKVTPVVETTNTTTGQAYRRDEVPAGWLEEHGELVTEGEAA